LECPQVAIDRGDKEQPLLVIEHGDLIPVDATVICGIPTRAD
jgi:hypothetical protein